MEEKKQKEREIQYNQLNYVCHFVFSRRSMYVSDEEVQVEIVENIEQVNGSFQVDQVMRPNRSSTLRLSEKDNFEFTLGAGARKPSKALQATSALKEVRVSSDFNSPPPTTDK